MEPLLLLTVAMQDVQCVIVTKHLQNQKKKSVLKQLKSYQRCILRTLLVVNLLFVQI